MPRQTKVQRLEEWLDDEDNARWSQVWKAAMESMLQAFLLVEQNRERYTDRQYKTAIKRVISFPIEQLLELVDECDEPTWGALQASTNFIHSHTGHWPPTRELVRKHALTHGRFACFINWPEWIK